MNLPTLKNSFTVYLQRVRRLSKVSIKNYLSDFDQFISWLQTYQKVNNQEEIDLGQINPPTLTAFHQHLLARKIAKSTVKRKLATVRVFCQFCLTQQLIETDPSTDLNAKKILDPLEQQLEKTTVAFSRWLVESGLSKSTITNYVADVKSYFQWVYEQPTKR